MKLLYFVLVLLLISQSEATSQGSYSSGSGQAPQYPPRPEDRPPYSTDDTDGRNQRHLQNQQQQQQQQQQPIPQQSAYSQQYPQYQAPFPQYPPVYGRYPPGYNGGDGSSPSAGILSKLKNSIFAAGSALSESLALSSLDGYPQQQAGNTPGSYSQQQQPQGQYGASQYPPGVQSQQPPGQYSYSAATPGQAPPERGFYPTQQQAVGAYGAYGRSGREEGVAGTGASWLGRFRNLFGPESDSSSSAMHRPMYPLPATSQQQQLQQQQQSGARLPPHLQQQPPTAAEYSQYPDPSTSPFDPSRFVGSPPASAVDEQQPSATSRRPPVPEDYPGMPAPQQQSQGLTAREMGLEEVPAGPHFPSHSGATAGFPGSLESRYAAYAGTEQRGPTAEELATGLSTSPLTSSSSSSSVDVSPEDTLQQQVSSEPQVFVHEDNIVMILRPREFHRKKAVIAAAGAQKLQVFTDFERVLTHFKNVQGERAVGSAELLDASGAVQMKAVSQLNALADAFDTQMMTIDQVLDEATTSGAVLEVAAERANSERYAAAETFVRNCQAVLCKEGDLHVSSIAPVVRSMTERLALRSGWAQTLQALSTSGVPTYLFSSGYGDVVAQVLLQAFYPSSTGSSSSGGSTGAQPPLPPPPLPQSLRVISNFFRAAPDGTVRAFSSPTVHDRNKNATTAAAHMGMPVLDRPHALVIGAHEDDLLVTEGINAELKERLSIGYLEATDDFAAALPAFLNAFDAVVLGDGSFSFVQAVVEELLQLSPSSRSSKPSPSGAGSAGGGAAGLLGQGIATGLRSRLGQLLSSSSSSSSSGSSTGAVQQQPAQYAYQSNRHNTVPAPHTSASPAEPRSYLEFTQEY